MIKVVEGNILDAKEDIIGHQVNCMGVMGSGLAKQIKDKYKNVYKRYKEHCKERDYDGFHLLGHNLLVEIDGGRYVSNLFGQRGYGKDKKQTDYVSLRLALIRLEKTARKNGLTVSLPYGLGCGLAGGDWDTVYEIIADIFEETGVVLYKYVA